MFSDVSTGEVIWHRITDCEKRSDMYDALSMYRPSEIILPGRNDITAKIFRILLKINLVMSYFLLFLHTHTQREVS